MIAGPTLKEVLAKNFLIPTLSHLTIVSDRAKKSKFIKIVSTTGTPLEKVIIRKASFFDKHYVPYCISDKNGLCTLGEELYFKEESTLLLAKKGYKTKKITLDKTHKIKHVKMTPGASVEIEVSEPKKGDLLGSSSIKVYLDNIFIGRTDSWGSFVFNNPQIKDRSLCNLSLKTTDDVSLFQTDFISGKSLVLKKIIHKKENKILYHLSLDQVNNFTNTKNKNETSRIFRQIKTFFRDLEINDKNKNLISMKRVPPAVANTSIKLRYLKFQNKSFLEVFAKVDNLGIVAAKLISLDIKSSKISLRNELLEFVDNLQSNYPIGKAIAPSFLQKTYLQLSKDEKRLIKDKNEVSLYGMQLDNEGQSQVEKIIAFGTIQGLSTVKPFLEINKQISRSYFPLKSQVIFNYKASKRREDKNEQSLRLSIYDANNKKPLQYVNLYLKNKWLGSSSERGVVYLNTGLREKSSIVFLREGYSFLTKDIKKIISIKKVNLKKSKTSFSIESDPPGALVYLDGKLKGKTPLYNMREQQNINILLVLKPIKGYQIYRRMISLNNEKISFTRRKKITLLPYLHTYMQKITEKRNFDKAVTYLEKIIPTNKNFLEAQYYLAYIKLYFNNQIVEANYILKNLVQMSVEETDSLFLKNNKSNLFFNLSVGLIMEFSNSGWSVRRKTRVNLDLSMSYLIKSAKILLASNQLYKMFSLQDRIAYCESILYYFYYDLDKTEHNLERAYYSVKKFTNPNIKLNINYLLEDKTMKHAQIIFSKIKKSIATPDKIMKAKT